MSKTFKTTRNDAKWYIQSYFYLARSLKINSKNPGTDAGRTLHSCRPDGKEVPIASNKEGKNTTLIAFGKFISINAGIDAKVWNRNISQLERKRETYTEKREIKMFSI